MKNLLIAIIAAAPLLHANVPSYIPLPQDGYTGTGLFIQMEGQSGQKGVPTTGGGGEFGGAINGIKGTISTNFWCVDDQEYFNFGQGAYGNITLLSDIGSSYNPEVRYSDVTNTSVRQWTNKTVGPGGAALPDSAGDRYRLAAWLVSQYAGFPTQIDAAGAAQNNAIQLAIWAITDTSGSNPWPGWHNGANAVGDPNVDHWINAALNSPGYQSLKDDPLSAKHWAVVSWSADQTGTLGTNNYDQANPALQTFLVQVDWVATPEPGFYAVLGIGLSGLLVAVKRKKIA